MNKFNESAQIEETTEYQTGELMNELNQQIEVNDKVKWIGYRGDEEVLLSATVESITEFNGVTNLVVRKHGTFPEDRTQTMIAASRITEVKKGI
jgi:hypothetical protein